MPERHVIPVTGDESVVAVHHEAAGDDWLVCCHGFRSDKSGSYEYRCRRAVEEGYDAVRFDFRGCGEADGDFADTTLSSRLADLAAVLEQFAPDSYTLFGSSFGGAVALHRAVDDDSVRAVATRAPVTYTDVFADSDPDAGADAGAVDRAFLDDLARYPFADAAAAIDVPVAIFHGAADESVPLAHSLEATGDLATDVLLRSFRDEGHRFSEAAEDRLQDALFDWLARLRGGA